MATMRVSMRLSAGGKRACLMLTYIFDIAHRDDHALCLMVSPPCRSRIFGDSIRWIPTELTCKINTDASSRLICRSSQYGCLTAVAVAHKCSGSMAGYAFAACISAQDADLFALLTTMMVPFECIIPFRSSDSFRWPAAMTSWGRAAPA